MTKGKKTEPREIDRWKPDDLTFIDNRTKKLSFSSPYDLENDLQRLAESLKHSQTEPKPTLLESILREFEDDAKKELEENGLDSKGLSAGLRTLCDPEDFSRLCKDGFKIGEYEVFFQMPLEAPTQFHMAAHVAFCVDRLRSDISNGDAVQTAIDMAKLCFTTVGAHLHEIIKRGIRAKNAPKKPRQGREKTWVLPVLEYARTNAKRKKFPGVITYLIAQHAGKEKALKIGKGKVYLSFLRDGDYRLNYVARNKKESIGYETLKKYFQRLKKMGI